MRSSETWPNAECNHLMNEARVVAASWRPRRTHHSHSQITTTSTIGTKPDDNDNENEKPSTTNTDSDSDQKLAKRFSPREKHSLSLRLDLGTYPTPPITHQTNPTTTTSSSQKKRVLHPKTSRYLTETLNSLLRILDIGKSGPLSASSTYINGKLVPTSDSSFVIVSGSLEEVRTARRVVKEFLWWVGAPVGSLLEGEALSFLSPSSVSSVSVSGGDGFGSRSGNGNGGDGDGRKGEFDLTYDSDDDDDDDKNTSSSSQEEKEEETSKGKGKGRNT
jgi:hypothetical protein